jgi:hypothetical protein
MNLCLTNGFCHNMKKLFGLAILVVLCSCGKSPTISNPSITQTFQIAPPQVNLLVSGSFTDLSTNPYSVTPFSLSTCVPSNAGLWTFQTGAHDTVEFQVTFSAPCTFSYYFGTSSIPPTPTPMPTPSALNSTSVATDANGNYTSSQITF